MQRIKESLLSQFKLDSSAKVKALLKNKSKALAEAEAANSVDSAAPEVTQARNKCKAHLSQLDSDLDKHRVFSKSFCVIVDKVALFWGKELQHQSDVALPRTYFPQGITCNSKLKACNEPGTLLLFLLLMVSNLGSQFLESPHAEGTTNPLRKKLGAQGGQKALMGSERLADWVSVIQEELLRDQLFCSNLMTVSFVNDELKKHNPRYLKTFHATVDQQEGTGMQFLKYHWNVHRPHDINKAGSLNNVDTEVCENAHKEKAKDPAIHTQQRRESLDEQVALRYYKTEVMSSTQREFNSFHKFNDDEDNLTSLQYVMDEGNSYNFLLDGTHVPSVKSRKKDLSTGKKVVPAWHDLSLLEQVEVFLRELFDTVKPYEIDEHGMKKENPEV